MPTTPFLKPSLSKIILAILLLLPAFMGAYLLVHADCNPRVWGELSPSERCPGRMPLVWALSLALSYVCSSMVLSIGNKMTNWLKYAKRPKRMTFFGIMASILLIYLLVYFWIVFMCRKADFTIIRRFPIPECQGGI